MTRIVLDLFLDCHQFGCLHRICRKFSHSLIWRPSRVADTPPLLPVGSYQCFNSLSPKLFPMFVQSSLFCFLWLLFRLLCILINSRDIHGGWVFALVLPCGMVLFISVDRLLRKKRSSLC